VGVVKAKKIKEPDAPPPATPAPATMPAEYIAAQAASKSPSEDSNIEAKAEEPVDGVLTITNPEDTPSAGLEAANENPGPRTSEEIMGAETKKRVEERKETSEENKADGEAE
jgi:hypothetical protein